MVACNSVNQTSSEIPLQGDNVFFVAPDGNDDDNGRESTPWGTIQYAVDNVEPGSVIYVREGVYHEAVVFNNSGSEEVGYITLQNYPGETPVISGEAHENDHLIRIHSVHHIKVIGFELGPMQGQRGFPSAFWILGSAHHIEVRDNNIHHIENEYGDAHGIAVYGTSTNPAHDILIDGNEVSHCVLGASESLVVNGNVENFTISNNVIHDNDNIGIDIIGHEGKAMDPELDQARDGWVIGNHVYNIDSRGNPAYGDERSADGIYVDGGKRIIIERNIVHDSNIGIEIASEWGGKDTSYITVRDNFIYHSHTTGIAIGGYDTKRGSASNNVIVNNTLFHNDTDNNGLGELLIQFQVSDTKIQNNIFYAHGQGLFIANPYPNSNVLVDYNLYYSEVGEQDSQWQWMDETTIGFDNYRAATGNDPHSQFANPIFVDEAAPDLHLGSDSPAIGAGISLQELGDADIDGNPRSENQPVNQGAHDGSTR